MNLGTKSLEATGEGSVSYLAFVKLSDLNTHWLSITAHFTLRWCPIRRSVRTLPTLTALDKRFRSLHARLVRHRLAGSVSSEGDSVNFLGNGNSENAVPVGSVSTGVHHSPGNLPNLFSSDPAGQVAVYNQFRQPILGLDNKDGGWGVLRGLPYWSTDLSIRKNIKITERFNFELQTVIVNVFNHPVFFDPGPGDYLDTSSDPDGFGSLPAQGNTPRTMEFGLRLNS